MNEEVVDHRTCCCDDMVHKVEEMILEDRRVKVKNIAAELGISQGSVLASFMVNPWRGMLSKGVLLLHDNAPAHSSVLACQAARECGYEILPHPAYSPDLAPSDFFLFPQLKSTLRGRRFNTDNDVITATEDYFSSKNRGFYKDGIRKVKNRWEKCVTLAGSYIEKE